MPLLDSSSSPWGKGLPDEVCPLSFPALVKDRQRWDEALGMKGILVTGWPSYHHEFAWEEFPETCNLKNSLVALPVHQSLEIYHMEYIAGCVKAIAKREDIPSATGDGVQTSATSLIYQ